MRVVYRHGYSPDEDLGDLVDLVFNNKLTNDSATTGDTFVISGKERPYTSFTEEGGRVVLHCPENY